MRCSCWLLFETVVIHDPLHQPRLHIIAKPTTITRGNHNIFLAMATLQDAGIQAAETLQTAHINPSPSIEHDVNPSTAASEKEPVRMERSPSEDILSDIDEDEVPLSILRPAPRKPQMPPLPDLRFEQSYLASIKDAKDWKVVTYITMRDQVCFPF